MALKTGTVTCPTTVLMSQRLEALRKRGRPANTSLALSYQENEATDEVEFDSDIEDLLPIPKVKELATDPVNLVNQWTQ